MDKNTYLIILSILFVITTSLLFYTTREGYEDAEDAEDTADVDCTTLSDCKTCADAEGCSWCSSGKCASNDDIDDSCPNQKTIAESALCKSGPDVSDADVSGPDVSDTDVSGVNNYHKYSSSDSDVKAYYASVKTLYKDISGNYIITSDVSGNVSQDDKSNADLGSYDNSNNYIEAEAPPATQAGTCANSKSCSSCMGVPDCFWCDTTKLCVSNNDVYNLCKNDKIFDSLLQCNLNKNMIPLDYQKDSIIPVLGLSRGVDDTLTESSLKIILDSLKARGYSTADSESKNALLTLVKAEQDYYSNLYTNSISSYIANGIDFKIDEPSLIKAQNIQTHIQDLKDVSRYIHSQTIEGFVNSFIEGFDNNLDTVLSLYKDSRIKTNYVNLSIQIIWAINSIALATVFFM